MSAPRYAYIISKRLDPPFAIAVGVAAATLRIKREETEKGFTPAQTVETLRRRVGLVWGDVRGVGS
ncbi:putative 1,4-beta-D-glucan cellobiohydrolase A [Venturia inaequalis]|nr:putative 1,4-beta-D-glucan cellobiohydrolase A [Venturia inaequalis]